MKIKQCDSKNSPIKEPDLARIGVHLGCVGGGLRKIGREDAAFGIKI